MTAEQRAYLPGSGVDGQDLAHCEMCAVCGDRVLSSVKVSKIAVRVLGRFFWHTHVVLDWHV
ncbi:hypothetical protein [Bradyrhizobium sp. LA7.1]|uniref:hypothetical protein n=1 Tax=Bradyrhizobium sp. LA7.1 TaxID=3156324 RepID=UPI00339A7519